MQGITNTFKRVLYKQTKKYALYTRDKRWPRFSGCVCRSRVHLVLHTEIKETNPLPLSSHRVPTHSPPSLCELERTVLFALPAGRPQSQLHLHFHCSIKCIHASCIQRDVQETGLDEKNQGFRRIRRFCSLQYRSVNSSTYTSYIEKNTRRQ